MIEPPYTPTAPAMLKHLEVQFGDLEAIVSEGDRLTYRELEEKSAQLARGLLAAGFGKASRLAILMRNSPDFAVTFMAGVRIGALVVPLSTLFQPPELASVLRHADIDTLIMDQHVLNQDLIRRVETALPELGTAQPPFYFETTPFLRRIFVTGHTVPIWARSMESLYCHPEIVSVKDLNLLESIEKQICPADLMFVIYTSGSTGQAKGVVHNHGAAIRHSYRMAKEYSVLESGDRLLSSRPWFWIAGLSSNLLYCLHAGGCLVAQSRDDPLETIDWLESEDISFISGKPPQFASLKAALAEAESRYTFRLIANNTAGVAVGESDKDVRFVNGRLQRKVPAATLQKDFSHFANFYGMTETLAAHAAMPQPDYLPVNKVPSSGRALSGIEHKLVDRASGEVVTSQPGELYVRGYTLMDGLYKRLRADVFEPDGFYRSGDICEIDEDGYVRVLGRVDDLLKINGANVSPIEVEQMLNLMPQVRDSAVYAFPMIGGQAVEKLMLVSGVLTIPDISISESDVLDFLKQRLSSFKIPRQIFFFATESVPHTASGKISKREFRLMVEQAFKEKMGGWS